MQISMFLLISALASPAAAKSSPREVSAVFESLDGYTVLLISGRSFYLGPKDHPEEPNFVQGYGERMQSLDLSAGKCVALGTFKIAKFRGRHAVCQNVHFSKSVLMDGRTELYRASCYALRGTACKISIGVGKAAFEYSYTVEPGRGVTKLILSSDNMKSRNNILALQKGALLRD